MSFICLNYCCLCHKILKRTHEFIADERNAGTRMRSNKDSRWMELMTKYANDEHINSMPCYVCMGGWTGERERVSKSELVRSLKLFLILLAVATIASTFTFHRLSAKPMALFLCISFDFFFLQPIAFQTAIYAIAMRWNCFLSAYEKYFLK